MFSIFPRRARGSAPKFSALKTTATLCAVSALALTGCSSNDDAAPAPAPSVTTIVVKPSPEATSAAPESSAPAVTEPARPEGAVSEPTVTSAPEPEAAKCGTASAPQAAQEGMARQSVDVQQWGYEPAPDATQTYDPCATFSYIVMKTVGGNSASSPNLVLLYSHGKYVGIPTRARAFTPKITQDSETQLTINYPFAKPHEPLGNVTGVATSYVFLDEASGTIHREGTLPPDNYETAQEAVGELDGIDPRAGGPIPADSIDLATRGSNPQDNPPWITTPSGKITCSLYGVADCTVKDYAEGNFFGSKNGEPLDTLPIFNGSSSSSKSIRSIDDMRSARGDSLYKTIQLEYGQSAHYASRVCSLNEKGLTCWDTNTGKGAYVTRYGYAFFGD